ncbi:MarR family winged helix-turn-helix transcriptional regulator [Limimaricola cinnabarinus]|uniref:MarR family winged helix-turn-helix transcriptional regulator n=1 Tax=Limimaricola cinnabarinus TaxID=1125964 RepID=UPI002490D522|nr:MarR family winged helix-turn-helix transcriptional regulator [Limimaricola cinnabarinus]
MTSQPHNMHFLLHSAALIEERLRQRLASVGVQHRQARVIDALSRMEPASQAALAREFGITPASMSTMTGRLIEAGYISRTPHPAEARSNLLRLTDTGRGLLGEIRTAWSEIDAVIEEKLGTAEAHALASLTRALRNSLGGHVPGTAASQDNSKET